MNNFQAGNPGLNGVHVYNKTPSICSSLIDSVFAMDSLVIELTAILLMSTYCYQAPASPLPEFLGFLQLGHEAYPARHWQLEGALKDSDFRKSD
jgi:hypothetical protein